MSFSLIEAIIALVGSFFKVANSFFVWLNQKFYYDAGVNSEDNRIMHEQNEVDRKQDAEMAKNVSKQDVENKLDKGEF